MHIRRRSNKTKLMMPKQNPLLKIQVQRQIKQGKAVKQKVDSNDRTQAIVQATSASQMGGYKTNLG